MSQDLFKEHEWTLKEFVSYMIVLLFCLIVIVITFIVLNKVFGYCVT